MPSPNPRLNVVLDRELQKDLRLAAKRRGKSLSAVAAREDEQAHLLGQASLERQARLTALRIEYLKDVVTQDIPDLPTAMAAMMRCAINARLSIDPVAYGKPLRNGLKGRWRLRVGDWRVVYLVDLPRRVVTITAIKHRKDGCEG